MLPSSRRAFAATAGRAARARQSADPNDPLTLTKQRTLDFDDVPTRMHAELSRDAERLHYHRLTEFEMPQLKRALFITGPADWTGFRCSFEPPPAGHVVASRHVRYHDEPDHPRSRRASLTVGVDALDMSATERNALIHLAGGRWNGIKRTVTVATDRFPELAQNERWAGDTLDRLVDGARQRADRLADLPLDDRSTRAQLERRGRTLTTLRDFPAEWLPDGASVTPQPSLSAAAREAVPPQPSQHGVAPSAGDW